MIVLLVMCAGILGARLLGVAGIDPLDSWQGSTRAGLALMFLFTGAAHFTSTRHDLVRMVPPALPRPDLLVAATGVAELLGAAGLLVPRVASGAAAALMLLLVAMFPANVHAARTGHTIAGRPHTRLVVRAPLQLFWIALLGWIAWSGAQP
jgi:uncharacterized membrane protein